MKPPGKLSGIGAAVAVAAAVLLSVPLTAATALAAPASRPAPAVPASRPAPAVPAPAAHPFKHSCDTVAKAGFDACFALQRTDIKAHKGLFAATADGKAPRSATAAAAASAAAQAPGGYGPVQLQSAYNLPSATAGAGQTVAIVDAFDDPNAAADLAVYRAQYGLPACTAASGCFRKVAQDGSTHYPSPDPTGGWESEESLDLDMVSAICPNCHILLVEAADNSSTNLGEAVDEAVRLGAKYVSNSYGSSEDPNETTLEDAWYNHPGVAVTAATGDYGYGVEYPAASQYVTAVGGTTLTQDSSSPRGWDETAWSDGGSGCSAYEPKPAWQTDTGCANRTVADVSADADPNTGVAVYDTYGEPGWTVFGGTSVASPIIASTFALAGTPVAGTYPSSYPYAHPSALNDITSGNNNGGSSCTPSYLCTAGPGYDGPTGLGTPDGVTAFTFGAHGTVSGQVVNARTGRPIAGAEVQIGSQPATTGSNGSYSLPVPAGGYTVTVEDYGYVTKTVTGTVGNGQSRIANFALPPLPTITISGTVTDGSGQGWPLYAKVSAAGTPVSAYTSPATGRYSLTLPDNVDYSLTVDPVYAGYEQAQASVQAGTSNLTQNFAVTMDPTACSAPGYQFDYTGTTQTFDGTTAPSGWSVVTASGSSASWEFGDPGGYPNLTGGSGNFAAILSGNNPEDSTLVSPVYDLSQDTTPYLQFNSDDESYYPDSQNIDVSIDGGQTWTTVWTQGSYPGIPGPDLESVPLPMAAGQSQVQVRFHWVDTFGGGTGFKWELDNVFVGNRVCGAVPGGLAEGTVTDANTGAAVVGATVTSADAPGVTTTTTPPATSPATSGGFYYLFLPGTGSQPVTAAMPDYTTTTRTADVTAGTVTPLNIALPTGRLAVSPGPVTATKVMGASATRDVTFANTGTAPVAVTLYPQTGQFTELGRSQNAAQAPAIRIKGNYNPGPLVAVRRTGKHASAWPTADRPDSQVQPDDAPWNTLASYPVQTLDNSAATDPATGLVYSVGGVIDDNGFALAVPSAYVYNPGTGAWTQLPNMSFAREKPEVAFIDGKLYVAGGWDNSGLPVPQVEVYNPATNAWTVLRNMPTPVAAGGVAVLNGDMYVVGGCDYFACDRTEVQVYHPSTDFWTSAAAYPQQISWEGCGGINGKVYCAAGYNATTGDDTANAYAFNPGTNSWSPIAPYPTDIWATGYAVGNGQLLMSGGIIQQIGTYGENINQGWAYDPANNGWTALPNSNEADYRGGSACGFYTIAGDDFELLGYGLTATTQQLPGYPCGTVSVPWLSESQTQFTINPGARTTIAVTLNAGDPSVSQPGTYQAALDISTDTPYLTPAVGVTLTAMPPATWGKITGTITGTECNGNTVPLGGATVEILGSTASYTLSTDPGGNYGLWLDQAQSPLTVLATDDNWQAQLGTVNLRAGKTTTASFTLTPLSC